MELFGAQKPLLQRSRLQYKAQCLLCLIPKPCSCWDDLPALPCQLNGSDQTASSHYRRAYIILGAKLVIHVFGYHSVQGAAGQRMIISVDLADRRPPSELSRCSGRESHLMCDVADASCRSVLSNTTAAVQGVGQVAHKVLCANFQYCI